MTNKKRLVLAAAAVAALLGCARANGGAEECPRSPVRRGLPVAICGDSSEVRSLQMDVTTPERITVERNVGKLPGLSRLADYAAVVMGCGAKSFGKGGLADWTSDAGLAMLEKYVQGGGNVIVLSLAGDAFVKSAKGQSLFGIRRFGKGASGAERVTDAAGRPWLWQDALSLCALETLPGAEALATVELPGGRKFPAAVRNAVGKGSFYWLSHSWSQYDMAFASKRKVAGEADDRGVFVLTPDGEAQKAMNEFLRDLLLGLAKIDTSAPPSTWGLKPLGEPGNMKLGTTLEHEPEFRKAPVRKPGIRFAAADVDGVVVAPSSNGTLRARGAELAWHLTRMLGREVKLVKRLPADSKVPAIVIGDAASCREFGVDGSKLRRGESILKRKGEHLLVYGRGSGQGFALTYLLESLGCRYLWPGKTGKVIPKKSEIVIPELDFDYVPLYKIRGMRDFKLSYRDAPGKESIKEFWGIDPKEFGPVYEASLRDDRGNRDFWSWHGVNDTRDVEGDYSWGHYFGHYWQKYGKEHPDWFALQPNGSREQELGNRPDRPCLCVSSRGLIEQAAKDAIAAFRSNPRRGSFSLCLPDGGYPSQCMCENCRRLDPVNAAPNGFYVGTPWWRWFPYVALSDRMMSFNNAVAEIVERECPGKKLGAYIYSMYEKPPVKVKPHPNLVLLTVAGSLHSAGRNGDAASNIAAWSRVAKELLWRPNTLFAFSVSAPQNYARQMFEELELFKANNVVGTDFDCVNGQFATKGLIFYAMAVAHRNPDRLCYDDVVADYCSVGFGKAAKCVAVYFSELEMMTMKGIGLKKGNNGFLSCLDVERLAKILDVAEKAAADDEEVLARLAYLRRGVDAGRIEKRLGDAWTAKSRDGVRAAQRELREFMRKTAFEEPTAVNPIWVSGAYHSPNMRNPNF